MEHQSRFHTDAVEDACYNVLKNTCMHRINEILESTEERDHFAIDISCETINLEDADLWKVLEHNPEEVLNTLSKCAKRLLFEKYEETKYSSNVHRIDRISRLGLHSRIHFQDMPEVPSFVFPGTKDNGIFKCILGIVVRTVTPKLLEYAKTYRCSKCKTCFDVEASAERFHAFPKLGKCPNMCVNGKSVQMTDEMGRNNEKLSKFKDYQEIKIQEQSQKMDNLELGSIPQAMCVILEDDLVDSCKPGDDVSISGYLFTRFVPSRDGKKIDCELAFKANHVQVINDQRAAVLVTEKTVQSIKNFWRSHELNPFLGRRRIVESFCPKIYGMYAVKLAICVVLAGGVSKQSSGSRVRGESHLLLVGDPGTGKSQLLKYITKVCPRSILTTGVGTTSAGLTVTAVKDAGAWQLEAGALVLADGGVCCIDEFASIKEHDRTSIHEAMEQQTISVAKAGIVCKLTTKCTIIGATNPKGKYERSESLAVNVGLASPLLSRFDLVIVLQDKQQDDWDNFLAEFVLLGKDPYSISAEEGSETWDISFLQAYLAKIRELRPEMSHAANLVLSRYYEFQRTSVSRDAARTTVRLLESIRRLAEGHAKLMNRDLVVVHDAVTAVSLMEISMGASSLLTVETSCLHTTYPDDPTKEYEQQARLILGKLELAHLWDEEKRYLDGLRSGRASVPPNVPETLVPGEFFGFNANNAFNFDTDDFSFDMDGIDDLLPPRPQHCNEFQTKGENVGQADRDRQEYRQSLKRKKEWADEFDFPDFDESSSVSSLDEGNVTETVGSGSPLESFDEAFMTKDLITSTQIEGTTNNLVSSQLNIVPSPISPRPNEVSNKNKNSTDSIDETNRIKNRAAARLKKFAKIDSDEVNGKGEDL